MLHLRQTQIDDAVRIIVANGVHVATGGLARIVDQTIALSHAESDVAPEIPLLGRGLRINLPIEGGRLIILANPLLLLRLAQLG